MVGYYMLAALAHVCNTHIMRRMRGIESIDKTIIHVSLLFFPWQKTGGSTFVTTNIIMSLNFKTDKWKILFSVHCCYLYIVKIV